MARTGERPPLRGVAVVLTASRKRGCALAQGGYLLLPALRACRDEQSRETVTEQLFLANIARAGLLSL